MKQGFTLIELLVVVLIIGILSAIALPMYARVVNKARLTEAITHFGDIKRSIDIYRMQYRNDTVSFLKSGGIRLDIDLQNSLDCDDSGCSSRFFTYTASCAGATCSISVTPTGTFAEQLPSLSGTRTQSGMNVTWTQTCTPPSGSRICDSTEQYGFNTAS